MEVNIACVWNGLEANVEMAAFLRVVVWGPGEPSKPNRQTWYDMFSKEALENYLKIKIEVVFYKTYVSQQGGGVVWVGTREPPLL